MKVLWVLNSNNDSSFGKRQNCIYNWQRSKEILFILCTLRFRGFMVIMKEAMDNTKLDYGKSKRKDQKVYLMSKALHGLIVPDWN